MAAKSAPYTMRRHARAKQAYLRCAMIIAAGNLERRPDDPVLAQAADEAAEAWLRNEEKLELSEARIDMAKMPEHRIRAADAPDDIAILLRIKKDRLNRENERRRFRGEPLIQDAENLARDLEAVPKPIPGLFTFEQAQAASDAKAEKRIKQAEARKHKAAERERVKRSIEELERLAKNEENNE